MRKRLSENVATNEKFDAAKSSVDSTFFSFTRKNRRTKEAKVELDQNGRQENEMKFRKLANGEYTRNIKLFCRGYFVLFTLSALHFAFQWEHEKKCIEKMGADRTRSAQKFIRAKQDTHNFTEE